MVFKSFFRKITTRIYIFIICLILFVLELLVFGQKYYINISNENYKGSYVLVNSKKDITEELNKLHGIKKIYKGVMEDEIILIANSKLQEKEIMIPEYSEYKINDKIDLDIGDKTYNLVVKDYSLIVNEKVLNEMLQNYKDYTYAIDLKNWANNSSFVNKLSSKFDIDMVDAVVKKNNIDYENIIFWFNVFIGLNIVLFIIVLGITIYNVLEDEKKDILMYKALGFNKKKIIKLNIQKLLLLLIIALLFNTITAFILNLL